MQTLKSNAGGTARNQNPLLQEALREPLASTQRKKGEEEAAGCFDLRVPQGWRARAPSFRAEFGVCGLGLGV